jgi:hypothetical protein
VVPASIHDFFVASSSVAGALIGLLFVAISVASERLTRAGPGAQAHRLRAAGALTAFTNALAVSLFALVPGHKIGPAASAMSIVGLVFVVAALLSLIRLRELRWKTLRDGLFVVGLSATFVIQFTEGHDVITHPGNVGAVNTIAVLVIVCFLFGIARAWELIGAPSIALTHEVTEMIRSHHQTADQATPDASGPAGDKSRPAAGDGSPPAS